MCIYIYTYNDNNNNNNNIDININIYVNNDNDDDNDISYYGPGTRYFLGRRVEIGLMGPSTYFIQGAIV